MPQPLTPGERAALNRVDGSERENQEAKGSFISAETLDFEVTKLTTREGTQDSCIREGETRLNRETWRDREIKTALQCHYWGNAADM